jgi:hypothetical protein
MHPFTAFLAAEHLQELLNEAEATRRAKRARPSTTFPPTWRRFLGRGVRDASIALGAVATRLDPESRTRPATQPLSRQAAR